MGWHFVGLLVGAILYAGANSLAPKDALLGAGLVIAAMLTWLWALVRALKKVGKDEEDSSSTPDTPSDPGAVPVRFGGFARQATPDELPWCIATSYRITYVVNGVESDPSDSVTVGPSATQADPRFTVTKPAGVDLIEWYRSIGTSQTWTKHTELMVPDGERFIDRTNPCDVFAPEPPTRPQPFGQFDGMWGAEAGPGFVPWCVPTRYRARYVRGTSIVSDWSEQSVEFRSDTYTKPGVRIENPRAGFTIEWSISTNITLPPGNSSGTDDPDIGEFKGQTFTFVRNHESRTPTILSLWLPLGDFVWEDNPMSITLNVHDFVDAWNSLTNSGEFELPLLSVTPSGKLALEAIPSSSAMTTILDDTSSPGHAPDWPGWWYVMGFDQVQLTNQPLLASRWPESQVVGTGPEFVDTANPCTTITPPDNVPVLVGWAGSVGAAGNRSEFPWCQPTSYRWSFVDEERKIESEPSEPSALVFAPVDDPLRHTPILAVQKPAGMKVKWYRNDNPQLKNNWVDHTHAMQRQSENLTTGEVRFTDMGDNPCTDPYRPPTPTTPPIAFEGGWNQIAGEGAVPWCIPTVYFTRHVVGNMVSDWSPVSTTFQSMIRTHPRLIATSTMEEFDTQWGRSDPTNRTIIFNCLGQVGGECNTVGELSVNRGGNITTITMDLSRFWNPDRGLIITTANDFIEYWNAQHGLTVGRLSIQPDRHLLMSLVTPFTGRVTFTGSAVSQWLRNSLGFRDQRDIANGTYPSDFPLTGPLVITPIDGAIGENFIDFDNPCVKPNRPTQAPQPFGWNRNFPS